MIQFPKRRVILTSTDCKRLATTMPAERRVITECFHPVNAAALSAALVLAMHIICLNQ
jgi:hypothetical protein